MYEKSLKLFNEARELFPGGVNSPVRAAVKPHPFYVKSGHGAYIESIDGEKYIDYVMGYGPLILGHSHPKVIEKVVQQLYNGWLYGTPHESALKLAKKIKKYFKYDMVRFVNSGTEATVTVLRLARGYTKRKKIIKFDGCYHGANDSLLTKAGSAVSHYGISASKGIPEELARLTYVLEYNNIENIIKVMDKEGDDIAAIILEPVIANTGVIPPEREFLKTLREETEKHNTILIFDEVVTGLRISLGGAKEYYSIEPDLITLGKIIGGGFPIGCVAGRREFMELLTPTGKVFNAGTFNANPISMVAGLATIEELEKGYVYRFANEAAKRIADALKDVISRNYISGTVNTVTSMYQIFFTPSNIERVVSPSDARNSDKKMYEKFHQLLLKEGVYIPPSQFETCFTSSEHRDEEVEKTIMAMENVLNKLKRG